MNLQVQDIIKDAMGLIGATEMDETPSSSELLNGMRIANIMLGRWSSKLTMVRAPQVLTIPLQAGVSSYTVGLSGADIIADKPIDIISGYVRDSSNIDDPIEVLTLPVYESLDDKLINQADVSCVAYDPGNTQQATQVGTIYVYPVPASNDTLILKVTSPLVQFSSLTDDVMMEPMYYEALIYNLAVRLFRRFHTTGEIPSDVIAIANSSARDLQSVNSTRVQAQMDMVTGGGYNIYTDE